MITLTPTPELSPLDEDELDRLFERLQKSDAPAEPDETPAPEPTDEQTT